MHTRLIIGAAIVIIGLAALWTGSDKRSSDTPAGATDKQTATDVPSTTDLSQSATQITFDGSRFTPDMLTVKAGTTVTIKNNSDRTLQFDSDPHPAHTDYESLNLGILSSGATASVTLNRVGTWGYHNHLNASESGKIIVE